MIPLLVARPSASATWRFGMALGAVGSVIAIAWCAFAVVFPGPLAYGEGAVISAARLASTGSPYGEAPGRIFVAANYTPLYYYVVGLGDLFRASDPFLLGRAVNVASWLGVGLVLFRLAAPAGRTAAFALASTWFGFVPAVMAASTARPDALEVALTAGGVILLVRTPRRAWWAGVLFALAVLTKQTAVVPVAVIAMFAVARDRAIAVRVAAVLGAAASLSLATLVLTGQLAAFYTHTVLWNALPWTFENLSHVLALAAVGLSVSAVLALMSRRWEVQAYVLGAMVVVALAGREGAYVNYLVHLSAASAIGLAVRAPDLVRLRWPVYLVALQLLLVVGMLVAVSPRDVPSLVPSLTAGRPLALLGQPGLDGALVEDSGLVVAAGATPIVDDLFLWSRLAEGAVVPREQVLEPIRAHRFSIVVTDAPLGDPIAISERWAERWPVWLREAVVASYPAADVQRNSLWFYR